jgi:transcriptional regulator with XRE-family HTH domain
MGKHRRNTFGMSNPTQKCDAQALFATNMRQIRKAKELTQEKVAELAELHPNYISSVERGERNISIRNIERIAKALDVTMAQLLSEPPSAAIGPKTAPDGENWR